MRNWVALAAMAVLTQSASAQAVRDFDPNAALAACNRVAKAEQRLCVMTLRRDTFLAANWYQAELNEHYKRQSARRDGDADARKMRYDTLAASLSNALSSTDQTAKSVCFIISEKLAPEEIERSPAHILCQADHYANLLRYLQQAYKER